MTRALSRSRELCEWEDFDAGAARMRDLLLEGCAGQLPPFHLLSVPGISAQQHRSCSELWVRERLAASGAERERLDFRFDRKPRERLRIGYLSNDFHEHATSHLLIETLERHDRARFEIHAFSFGADDGGPLRRRIRAACTAFHDVTLLDDADAARAIHSAGIDILVDLKGYTRGARTGILMLRPAPLQVNYLGYPGTLGAGICDYIITDPFVTPIEAAADYAEAFAYMPHSYQPHGQRGAIGRKPSRTELGLPDEGFVFCCFNQAYKFTPPRFDLWCRLLEATPGSVLWLLADERAQGNLRGAALRQGIAPHRLVFAPHWAQQDHLGRLQHADLVLDTAPFGAHTTASDALWAGVPVLTCPGDTFASRVAGSLLRAVGMPELIARDADAYLAIALSLATDGRRLVACKARLRRKLASAALFDVAGYTCGIEDLFERMWARHRAGAAPAAIGRGARAA